MADYKTELIKNALGLINKKRAKFFKENSKQKLENCDVVINFLKKAVKNVLEPENQILVIDHLSYCISCALLCLDLLHEPEKQEYKIKTKKFRGWLRAFLNRFRKQIKAKEAGYE